jgi:hypothetical protein
MNPVHAILGGALCDQGESVRLSESHERSQFVFKPAPPQANQGLTAQLIDEQEYLIPGQLGETCREFFKRNTLALLNERQEFGR